jgi:hypothetical protein
MKPLVSSASLVFRNPCWFARSANAWPEGRLLRSGFCLLPTNTYWNHFSSRFQLAASLGGTPVRSSDPGDDLLSVSAFLGPKHLSLFSPTGDPSKPGTGTTLLFYGGAERTPGNVDRPPGPVFNATKLSFRSSSFDLLSRLRLTTYTGVPGEAESGSAGVQPDEE